MTKLEHYLADGANRQARAVIQFVNPNIEESWDHEHKEYKGIIVVARWENGREQGYILSLLHLTLSKQWNIVVYEHRNSDNICAISWEQTSMNSITLQNLKHGVFKDKYDVSHEVNYGEILSMADWINEDFERFWTECEEKMETK